MARGDFPLQSLYGGKPQAQAAVNKGLTAVEKELQSRFDTTRRVEEQTAELFSPIAESVAQLAGDRATNALKGLGAIDKRLGGQTLDAPAVEKVDERIFTGSIGATVVPPYNYQWTWNAQTGGPQLGVNANRNNGQLAFNIWNAGRSASGSAAAAEVPPFGGFASAIRPI